MRGSAAAWVVLPLLALGCRTSGSAASLQTTDRSEGQFVQRDAPPPRACATDADCHPGPFVDPDNGCCDTGVPRGVFGKAYLDWRAGWVREHCGRVECPMMPPPAPSPQCALTGRCVEGECRDTCGPGEGL